MPAETVGEAAHLFTANHPARSDSPEYVATRKWLMSQTYGGCLVCNGVPDMGHPEVADPKGMQDHHGNGLHYKGVLFAMGLLPTEWSLGWAADPARVAAVVELTNQVLKLLGEATYDLPVTDTPSVMAWVDSQFNASIILCAAHHISTQTQDTPDARGYQAVGIHEIPLPIWAGQISCQFARFDMWAGTTGTLAVAPAPAPGGILAGHVQVLHVDTPSHPGITKGDVLPPHHPHARLAHTGTAAREPAPTVTPAV